MGWMITAPKLTVEERKAIAQDAKVARRRRRNKAARTVWAFAKAAGMTDELTVREQEREAKHRAAIEDPNGLFQIMRRKHEE